MQATAMIPAYLEEAASAVFWLAGCEGIFLEDPYALQRRQWEELSQGVKPQAQKDRILVMSAVFSDDELGQAAKTKIETSREAFASLLVLHRLPQQELVGKPLTDLDWRNEWKKFFHPTKVGAKTVICPSWEAYEPKEGEIVVTIDPGLAFGTGEHATTTMCIRAIEAWLPSDARVADIGTGSGILAIASAKLGAKSVTAVDCDEMAVRTAKQNVILNGVADQVTVSSGDLTERLSGLYDVIVANIVADVILSLLNLLDVNLIQGGIFIASGIIQARAEAVRQALVAHKFVILNEERQGEWHAFACKR